MPNPSELERLRQEEEELRNPLRSKSAKEEILRELRRLERKLGVKPRNYNGGFDEEKAP